MNTSHRTSLQPLSRLAGIAMLVLATGALAQQPAEAPGRAAPPAAADGDILLNDFEAADYGGWKTAGTAFGTAPAKGTLDVQREVSGFEGKGLVNTYLGGGGECYKTSARRDMGKPLGKISLTAQGGALTVESLTAHEMKSVWQNK